MQIFFFFFKICIMKIWVVSTKYMTCRRVHHTTNHDASLPLLRDRCCHLLCLYNINQGDVPPDLKNAAIVVFLPQWLRMLHHDCAFSVFDFGCRCLCSSSVEDCCSSRFFFCSTLPLLQPQQGWAAKIVVDANAWIIVRAAAWSVIVAVQIVEAAVRIWWYSVYRRYSTAQI